MTFAAASAMGFVESLLVQVIGGIVGGVVTAVLLGVVVALRDATLQVDAHDREVAAINEDAERFIRDRDRERRIDEKIATIELSAQGQLYSSAIPNEWAEARHRALHQYRDEISRKLRRYRQISADEGRWHGWVRSRRTPLARFELSSDALASLSEWRKDATGQSDAVAKVDDPTSAGPGTRPSPIRATRRAASATV